MNSILLQKLSEITDEENRILSGSSTVNGELYSTGNPGIVNLERFLEGGKNIAIRPHTRFIDFPEHTHDYVEMVYMCSGQTTHTVNGHEIVLKEGELLILGRKAVQSIKAAGKDDICVNFIIRPDFFSETLPFLGNDESPLRQFIVNILCGGEGDTYLYFKVAKTLPLQNLIENLIWTVFYRSSNHRDLQKVTMGLLFAHLINETERLETESSEQETVMNVLRYIEGNYREGTLSGIANALHYEISWLSRLIKSKTGLTFTELLQEKRLSQTVWMLKNTDKNISDIAESVGYENISYFHRLFFKKYGMSPKKYRDTK